MRPSKDFLDAMHRTRCPIIVAHVTPDADALGAILGLAAAFREHEIASTVGLPGATVAAKLRFMLDLVPHAPLVDEWQGNGTYDALFALDSASEKRINIKPPVNPAGPLPIFNIDHHLTNTNFGRFNWVDAHASSSCELLARLLGELGWKPTPVVASLLYAGIFSDTAGFSLPSATAGTFQIAADLTECGADVALIGEQLCRSQGRGDFDLLRRVYDNTQVVAEGQIAYSSLSHHDITSAGCTAEDIDDQVSVPRSLKGVRIALLFTEGEPGVIRVNLRGEGRVTVLDIAKRFDGGGHAQSAGIRFRDRGMDEAIRAVVEAARQHLRMFDAG
jgi:phosphoesterase RecJ-like protein